MKSRLARHIGSEAAAHLYVHFLAATVELALRTRPLLTPVGIVAPDEALGEVRKIVDDRLPLWPQGQGELGERMERSAHRAFRGGAERAVIVGSDTPDLPLSYLVSAARRLDRYDLILGPADDGGYYLIAMKWPVDQVFRGVDWSTQHVLDQTIARARKAGLKTGFLPRWRDVDEPEELKALARRLSLRKESSDLSRAVERALVRLDDHARGEADGIS